jgi:hypothetical protein
MSADHPLLVHQTIRLSRGSHRSPQDGACVMELASVLAGESFSDHPECVSPVIATMLRAYNDRLDDARRQELLPYASAVVGTRAADDVEWARAERLARWAESVRQDCSWLRRTWAGGRCELHSLSDVTSINRGAVELLRRGDERAHRRYLALLDELIAMSPGTAHAAAPAPAGVAPSASARV